MSQNTPADHISKKRMVYTVPGMDAVTVRGDVEYRVTDAGALTMDLYYPPGAKGATPLPAIVVALGYSDPGYEKALGCKFKEMAMCVSLGELAAASGIVAVVYTNREPMADLQALLQYVRQHAAPLGIDEQRIGMWASSGNVPLALSVLIQEGRDCVKCAVLCDGFMLDLDGATGVAEASATWRFVNPAAGKSVDDLPQEIPMFVVRAGQDQYAGLNASIDRFMANALHRNLPVTCVNHPAAPHAFDLFHDSDATREIIRQMLRFMQFHLQAQAAC
jgi:hypothetical protein